MSKEIEKTAKEIVEKYKAITGYAHPSNTCETAKQCALLEQQSIINFWISKRMRVTDYVETLERLELIKQAILDL